MSLSDLQARQRANFEAGLCRCGEEREAGRKSCRACLDRNAATQRERRRESRRNNRCVRCNFRPARPGLRSCEECKNITYKACAALRRRRRAAGLCALCGAVPEPGYAICEWCLHVRRCRNKGVDP